VYSLLFKGCGIVSLNVIYTCLGASNHALEERQTEDYYATAPIAGKLLLEVEPNLKNIWECACGEGHLAKVFENSNKLGLATDLIYRGYGNLNPIDFLTWDDCWDGDIVTNPPYKFAKEFTEKALNIVKDGSKVCMFLKVTFLEGKARKAFFKKYPPKTIYVCSGRISCAKNGDFEKYPSSAIAYAWYVWEKGFIGKPTIEWIN
jgi:hypothetical protein